ncbi:putative F-box domain-containing protein [Helianthus annuus]|nr:putative F-box domain-containing protein [Helianthus annuus]
MSDNIPFEIQEEIIKKLPVKSLIQFRSVSKPWKSLIDSTDFIKHYRGQMQHLLVRYIDKVDIREKNISIVDDDSFPTQRVSVTRPTLFNMLKTYVIIGSSHGLLCLYSDGCDNMVVLWNLSIRKAVAVDVRYVSNVYDTVIGFGVCRETSDPKIVKITYIHNRTETISIPDSIPWQVEVFTLSTGVWRSPCNNLPRKAVQFTGLQMVVWMMEGDVQKTFTKLFTIYTPAETVLTVLEFRKSGEPVIEYRREQDKDSSLVVYDPCSKQFNNLEINGRGSYNVCFYTETLLLLDQPEGFEF